MPETPPAVTPTPETAPRHMIEEFLRQHLVALVPHAGTSAGTNVLVTRLPFVVGRGRSATMTLADATVSRRHAQLRLTATGHLELLDLGSSNGCWVNDERVSCAPLRDGDAIRFGSVRFLLLLTDRGRMTRLRD